MIFHTSVPIKLTTSIAIDPSVTLVVLDKKPDLMSILDDFYNCSVGMAEDDVGPELIFNIDGPLPKRSICDLRVFLGGVVQDAVAALSLSIVMSGVASTATTPSPVTSLFHAVVKRTIVGTHILWREQRYTTAIQLKIEEKEITLQIQSVTANKTRGADSPIHYIILPSTRITIENDVISCRDVVQEAISESHFASPAIKVLVETINAIRQYPKLSLARSFIFSGQPGTGKTYAINMASKMVGLACQLTSLNGSEIMASGHGPEAARSLEQLFIKAHQASKDDVSSVALVFLDEFDALAVSEHVTAMLGMLLDRVSTDAHWRRFLVVAATNRIDAVPAHLRRPGRFDKEHIFAAPDVRERQLIIQRIMRQSTKLEFWLEEEQLESLAENCVGFVPADLVALVRKAMLLRFSHPNATSNELLNAALSFVGASALRDAALTAPPATTWSDIAGDCGGAKLALQQAIEWPRTRRIAYQRLGLQNPRGCLLYGPPGTGKTMLARAAAGSSGLAFLSLSPADVYASSYVGDAEAIIRRAFDCSRAAAPCILFFDELDSILGFDDNATGGMTRGHSAEARILSTFLNEMDGIDGTMNDGVMVLGATNRPETIDRALLRPGRFDKVIHVPPPDLIGRRAILEMQCCGWKTDEPLDYDLLAQGDVTGGMTGAEMVGACREAAMEVFHEIVIERKLHCMGQSILFDALHRARPM
ncbi:hypothetical protein MPSEU_000468800 [Mayamaea pseudoterrestris]|nr:hypothetical protein MPSEU_000468800 [Mayamaea pseudoterrestris]